MDASSEPIISVSGLRGVVGKSLTPEIALRYTAAFASTLGAGPIVITRDGRATGRMLAAAVTAGLNSVGRQVLFADVAATPTTGVLVQNSGAAGGVQISASHNPPEYNGLKLFSALGRVIPADAGERVIARYRSGAPQWVEHAQVGEANVVADPHAEHLARVLATVDVDQIRARKFRVLLDANHGAGSQLGARLLAELGCETTILGATPDGRFAHTPEPTAENLSGVLAEVVRSRADIGFCQDPDADRLALIDADGRYLGEEYTLALCVDHVLRRSPGPIVTNCSTSRMTEDLAAKYGVPFYRSKVGEANVVDEMLARSAVLGGEGNGGAIDPRVVLVRDSFVGMALVLAAMAERGKSVAELAGELPAYAIHKSKVTLPAEKVAAGLDALQRHFTDAKSDRLDGLRLDWPGRWLLVRASNTEPIVRLVAEAPSEEIARELCQRAAGVLSPAV